MLSARAVVDFLGPHGLELAAINLGRLHASGKCSGNGVNWGIREIMPLVEVRVPFKLELSELDAFARGAEDIELAPLEEAARKIASFEDDVVYNGLETAGIKGIVSSLDHKPLKLGSGADEIAAAVGEGVAQLKGEGIAGPYDIVFGPKMYKSANQVLQAGRVLRDVLERISGGSVLFSPSLKGGLLLSRRGGDFQLTVGQDFSIGYEKHDGKNVELFIMESFAFRVLEPAAGIELKGG
jgi:uncharacterized linocin/CFP29 family protein